MPDDVADLTRQLGSPDPRDRLDAAAGIGRRVGTSGEHALTTPAFRGLASLLVDVLLVEDDRAAFESELCCLVELAEWELVAAVDVDRALAAESAESAELAEHWAYLRECRSLYDPDPR